MLLFDVGNSGSKPCLNKYLKIYAKQSSFNREEQERSTEQEPGVVSITVDKAHALKVGKMMEQGVKMKKALTHRPETLSSSPSLHP